MGLLIADEGDAGTGLKHPYPASDILADADLTSTSLSDRVEEAIEDLGGQTLARASRRYEEYEEPTPASRTDRQRDDDRWQDDAAELPYPPDELIDERTQTPY